MIQRETKGFKQKIKEFINENKVEEDSSNDIQDISNENKVEEDI